MPKPLVEFANKPMILHQIEALAAVGVTDVVLAVNYRPEIMERVLKEVSNKKNPCIKLASSLSTLLTSSVHSTRINSASRFISPSNLNPLALLGL